MHSFLEKPIENLIFNRRFFTRTIEFDVAEELLYIPVILENNEAYKYLTPIYFHVPS